MSSWSETRLDRVATVSARIGWKALTADEYQAEGVAFLATPNIKKMNIDFTNVNYISQFRYEESPDLKLKVGDVLLAKDGNTLGITNVVSELPRPATVNGSIAVIRPFNIDGRFLRYQLDSVAIQGRIQAFKDGMGVPHLFQRDINRFPLVAPPLAEQRAIADYLDAETARIDALIAKKQLLIHLLEERRRSHVDRLLWRGRVARLKFVADVVPGYAFPSGDFSPDAAGPRLLRGINVGVNELSWTDVVHLQGDEPSHDRYVLVNGDVVVGMDRPFISKGTRVAPIGSGDAGALLVQRVCRLRPARSSPVVLVAALSSPRFQAYVESDLTGVSVPHLSDEQIGNFEVPADLSDSEVSAIEDATHELGRVGLLLKKQLDLLAEHRQGLITAAVTGTLAVEFKA